MGGVAFAQGRRQRGQGEKQQQRQRCVRCGGSISSGGTSSSSSTSGTDSDNEIEEEMDDSEAKGEPDTQPSCSAGSVDNIECTGHESSPACTSKATAKDSDESWKPDAVLRDNTETNTDSLNESSTIADENKHTDTAHRLPCRFGRGGECSNSILCPAVKPQVKPQDKPSTSNTTDSPRLSSLLFGDETTNAPQSTVENTRDKYLIFTTGTRTFTPHQIGIKRMRYDDALGKMSKQAESR